jgi:NADPH-dependent 2,4-dienoyl-CoA reductase/sulfur reductase-like enzyme
MLMAEAQSLGVEVMLDTVAWGIFENRELGLVRNDRTIRLQAERVLLSTGAIERPLAFPGWTLPGVIGAGAAQTLINIHRVLPGKRVLMVGSGNVGLIVAYQLLQAGAEVVGVIEALPRIGGYQVHASKLRRFGVPIHVSTTILKAEGDPSDKGVNSVVTAQLDSAWQPIAGTEKYYQVDVVCLAVGLSPLAELAWMAGCEFTFAPELGGFVPLHNRWQESTIPGIYIAGDAAGIEEVTTAIEGGRIVGASVACSLGKLDAGELENRCGQIDLRVMGLRSGQLGEGRHRAKRQVVEECDLRLSLNV